MFRGYTETALEVPKTKSRHAHGVSRTRKRKNLREASCAAMSMTQVGAIAAKSSGDALRFSRPRLSRVDSFSFDNVYTRRVVSCALLIVSLSLASLSSSLRKSVRKTHRRANNRRHATHVSLSSLGLLFRAEMLFRARSDTASHNEKEKRPAEKRRKTSASN